MVMTTLEGDEAIDLARETLAKHPNDQDMIEMVSAILVNMFTQLTREEISTMLGIPIQGTRVYEDAKAEGKAEMLLALISFRFGAVPDAVAQQISELPDDRLEALGTALFALVDRAALEAWLANNAALS